MTDLQTWQSISGTVAEFTYSLMNAAPASSLWPLFTNIVGALDDYVYQVIQLSILQFVENIYIASCR